MKAHILGTKKSKKKTAFKHAEVIYQNNFVDKMLLPKTKTFS
jgi:hypothetical protein